MPNRLAKATSPYLRQHAENPVDWYPWGEEALQKARAENKPIFLSIGYSACHWCHVMAHESFEDPAVAALLSERFVSIKVDREERPDLDRIYMEAVQALTGGGGWPLSVFLTPDGRPFYGGTYFPPTPRQGMSSFTQVLLAVSSAWETRRGEVVQAGEQLLAALRGQRTRLEGAGEEDLKPEAPAEAVRSLRGSFDRTHGGWDKAPKFPQPMVLEFLLRHHHRTGDPSALEMVAGSLEAMARGGIYDQLGGGFHRYSVDARWLVPHFEKMLYDNALLARVYLHAWQVTGRPLFRQVAEETLDYALREMLDPAGGFYSAQDADSEGEEGKFYLWRAAEIRAVLGEDADRFMAAYGVTEAGNFEGRNILSLIGTPEERDALAETRRRLLAAREGRVPPGRDEKVLTSWNGLMLGTFAEAGRALGRDDYLEVARRNADFLLRELRPADGRLWHSWRGGAAGIAGFLEDHTHLLDGLLELYQADFDPRWFLAAAELAEAMVAHFGAPTGFFDTADDAEALVLRPRSLEDGAVPSGNAMAAFALLRLAGLAVRPEYDDLARRSLAAVQPLARQYPLGFGQWLVALDYAHAHPREVALVGNPRAPDTRALLAVCTSGFRPHQVVAMGDPASTPGVPLLEGRGPLNGHAAAYVCVDHACLPPVTDPDPLAAILHSAYTPPGST